MRLHIHGNIRRASESSEQARLVAGNEASGSRSHSDNVGDLVRQAVAHGSPSARDRSRKSTFACGLALATAHVMSFMRRVLVVLGIGLIAYVSTATWRARSAHARFVAARERTVRACRAYRSQQTHADVDVCREQDAFGQRPIEKFQEAKRLIVQAKNEFAGGDKAGAERSLQRALALSAAFGHRGTLLTEVIAHRTLSDVLDALAALPELDARVVLAGSSSSTYERPFEGESIHRRWLFANYPDQAVFGFSSTMVPGRLTHSSEGELADAIEANEGAYPEIERTTIAGDRAACERTRETARASDGSNECELLAFTGRTRARLEEALRTGRVR